jgi:indolepyruvate ferredoxin oxidoreductase
MKKRAYGGWMLTAFHLLAKLKGLRGTALDIFGYSAERKLERQLIADYERAIADLLTSLTHDNHGLAVEIAGIPEQIRGYGHVKQAHLDRAKAREAELLAAWRAPAAPRQAAE